MRPYKSYFGLTRRNFLASSAGVFASTVLEGGTCGGTDAFSIRRNDFQLRSFGWFPFGESSSSDGRLLQRIVNPSRESTNSPIPALENAAVFTDGDREFADRGLRLIVWGAVSRILQNAPDAIDVEVLYEPYHSNRFSAWSFRKRPVWTEQSPSRLFVPIDANYGLNLNVSMRWGQTTEHDANPPSQREWNGSIRLAIASDPGAPKLMRGIYAIPLSDRGDYDLRRLSEGQPLIQAASPFLLLETEYGDRRANVVA